MMVSMARCRPPSSVVAAAAAAREATTYSRLPTSHARSKALRHAGTGCSRDTSGFKASCGGSAQDRGDGALGGLLIYGFFALRVTAPKYWHTLWSTVSGRQCVHEYFTKGESDEDKMIIFSCNRLLWEGDIGGDVQLWTLENWAGWVRDAPAWFTPLVVATVPDEYIPKVQLAALGTNRERPTRRRTT